MKGRLISAAELANLAGEETNAHRFWTFGESWIDRFDGAYLVSHAGEAPVLTSHVRGMAAGLGLRIEELFSRRHARQPTASDVPELADSLSPETRTPQFERTVLERGLKFRVDFRAGYSVGLFCDQRANRAYLESLKPRRVLNCFAYTCAFSVAAARAGAETLSLDLSRKALDWGRINFELNGFNVSGHRFIADDVFYVLPRLARRGEKFDAVILDPPTFSRGSGGKVFQAQKHLPALLDLARGVAAPNAAILLSTNATSIDGKGLARLGRDAGLSVRFVDPLPEYPPGSGAATVWLG